jgi:hypothetical protein
MPSLPTATLKSPPAAMLTMFERPLTWTGVFRVVVVPSPSSPREFRPHAHTVPSDFRARL